MDGFDLLQDDNALDALCPDIDLDFIGEGNRNANKISRNTKQPQGRRSISTNPNKEGSNSTQQQYNV